MERWMSYLPMVGEHSLRSYIKACPFVYFWAVIWLNKGRRFAFKQKTDDFSTFSSNEIKISVEKKQ